jgi:hypothetical protein
VLQLGRLRPYLETFDKFRIGATFEMIRTELREICILIDPEPGVAAPFKWKRERQGSGETERERGSVCASVGRHRDSVGQHPQTTRRKRTYGNTYCEHLWKKECGGLFD